MLFFDGASLGVLVTKDKMDLVGHTTDIGTKHDGVGRVVLERAGLEGGVGCEEFEVSSTAGESIGELDIVLENERGVGGVSGGGEDGGNSVVLCLFGDLKDLGCRESV